LIGLLWLIFWDILHMYAAPTWALSLSCTISGGLGYFMGNRLKNQQVFWLCLFNLMMLVFVGVVAPGFLYFPCFVLVSFFICYFLMRFGRRRMASLIGTTLMSLFAYFFIPHYFDWELSLKLEEKTFNITKYNYHDYNTKDSVTSQDGVPRILSFWNLGCGVCLLEMDMLAKLSNDESIEKDFEILCVYEHDTTRREKSMAYFNKYKSRFQPFGNLKFALDSTHKNTVKEYGFPQLYIFNAAGERVLEEIGYDKSMESLKMKKYKKMLEEG
jgi:thiol-disulfide isomerase/thioredoxin